MPDGVVQWFDPASGDAAIVRGGKVFRAAATDLEPVARHPGVRVHFDIHRDHGVDRAVGVTLRPGTRVPRAPFAHAHPELGLSAASHPLEVARVWARCMQAADLDTAMLLYSPDARIHTGTETLAGRSHLKGYLEASPLLGNDEDAEVRGEDGAVVVAWDQARAQHQRVELRCRIEHGQIAEQWIRPAMPPRHTVTVPTGELRFDVQVVTKGDVAPNATEYALTRLGATAREMTEPILFARLKLEQAADPARDRPSIAQVSVDIDGQLVRAHVAGHDMREAVDLLQQRLRDKLEHRAEHRKAERNRSPLPQPGEWRHGDVPTTDRPEHFDRPADERELIRHKSYTAGELTPDEAAFDMEQLVVEFYLLLDLAT
jgi:ribosome-associated translation inhibitor RaiA